MNVNFYECHIMTTCKISIYIKFVSGLTFDFLPTPSSRTGGRLLRVEYYDPVPSLSV